MISTYIRLKKMKPHLNGCSNVLRKQTNKEDETKSLEIKV